MEKPLQCLFAALKGEKKITNLILAAGLVGMLLIALSEWLPSDSGAAEPSFSDNLSQETATYALDLEERLENLIRQVDGAGKTQVMVTMAESSRTVYATDSESEPDGALREQHLLLADDSDPPALVESEQVPQVQGVAVLCEGGGSVTVQSRVTQIVQVLTDVGTNHITVERLTEP